MQLKCLYLGQEQLTMNLVLNYQVFLLINKHVSINRTKRAKQFFL